VKKFTQTWQTNWSKRLNKYVPLLVVALVFGSLGTALLLTSHATTPTANVETENGTVSAAASKVSDTTASGSQAVKFGAASGGFQANCITSPHVCGYPDATNTGVPAGTTLTTSGCITVTTNGAVIQNLSITDCNITVKANNVTIKNTRISGCTYYPIDYDDSLYSGLVIQDSEIASNCTTTTACMSFADYTVIRMNCHGAADGFKANSNVVIQDSYIHDLAVTSSSHNDGVQSTGGSTVTFKHNTCDLRAGGDDCFQPGPSDTGWLYTNNLLAGGPTTCWMLNGNTGTVNSTFTGNRFTRTFSCGAASLPGTGITWSGNYFDDNGATTNQ